MGLNGVDSHRPNEESDTLPTGLSGVVPHGALVLSIAGALSYAVVGLSYGAFYGIFGVDPSEVGLDRTAILLQAGVSLVVGFAGLSIILLPIVLVIDEARRLVVRMSRRLKGTPTNESSKGVASRPIRAYVRWGQALVVAPIAIAVYFFVFIPGPVEDARKQFLDVLLYVISVGILISIALPDRHILWHRRLLSVAAFAGIVFLLTMSGTLGQSNAKYLRQNGELPPLLRSPYSPLNIKAECVEVFWMEPKGKAKIENEVILLGQADSTVVLYDAFGGSVFRVPSSSITLQDRRKACVSQEDQSQ